MQGDGGVGVAAGVEHRAVKAVEVRLLERVDQRALVVGLDAAELNAQLFRLRLAQGDQVVIGLRAVNGLLPEAGQVDVGAVEDQDLLHR